MKRREFLRHMAAMPLLTGGAAGLLTRTRNAYAATGKTVVVIFQRGGCDGLNTVVPYGEDEYYRLRPDIAIARPGSGSRAALDLDGFLGLNPAMGGLYNVFQQGHLAVLPTVHYRNGNRSHFSSQDFIESGVANVTLKEGWLNRHLSSLKQDAELRAVSFDTLSHSLRGSQVVTTLQQIDSTSSEGLSASTLDPLAKIYQQRIDANVSNRVLLQKHGMLALDNLAFLSNFDTQSYAPENGAVYPQTQFGKQLRDIALLIKSGVGLEIVTINNSGWDDHANQGGVQGAHAARLQGFSNGIEALYKDLGASHMNDVVILTMSEFGRTAKQNASNGTDHGNATSWFVIGHQVNGGIYGEWPGLLPDQLYQGRYLAHTIEFTDILGEIVVKHLGNRSGLSTVLPGARYSPVGFL